MTIVEAVVLGLVQGLAEFLPISSSGHLALVSNLFRYRGFSLFIYLHLASLIAVIFYTRSEIKDLLTTYSLCQFYRMLESWNSGTLG